MGRRAADHNDDERVVVVVVVAMMIIIIMRCGFGGGFSWLQEDHPAPLLAEDSVFDLQLRRAQLLTFNAQLC